MPPSSAPLDALAIFSGRPAFPDALHVGRPNVGDRERLLARLTDIIDRRYFTNNGPYVVELETRIAARLGVKHCVAMCNATVALEIAIRALGLSGEVIIPSMTFIATAHALQWQEITPVFCDVAPGTHHIDPVQVERLITPRTSGIIGVHVWGHACDVDALSEVAHRHDLKLMFDAAHAFACTYRGRPIGGFGNAEVLSFHATKFFNSFEGGAVVTNDDALAEKLRLMRNFGFAGFDNVIYLGTNGKMSEPSAAMGLTSLESLDDFIACNRENYLAYRVQLEGLKGLVPFSYDAREQSNYQYVVLEVFEQETGLSRDELVEVLMAENVIARRYFHPGCHRMEPYRSYFPHAGLLLPNTEALTPRLLSLPTGTAMDAASITRVCDVLRTALAHPGEVRARLASVRAARGPTAAGTR